MYNYSFSMVVYVLITFILSSVWLVTGGNTFFFYISIICFPDSQGEIELAPTSISHVLKEETYCEGTPIIQSLHPILDETGDGVLNVFTCYHFVFALRFTAATGKTVLLT